MAVKRTNAEKITNPAVALNEACIEAAKARRKLKDQLLAGADPDPAGEDSAFPEGMFDDYVANIGNAQRKEAAPELVLTIQADQLPKAKNPARKIKVTRKPPEELDRGTSAETIFCRLIEFGKQFNVDNDNDFREAVRNYAEESVLIIKMRDQVDQDGLTTWKSYKTGDQMVAHPLIQEISRHVDCANRTLSTISDILKNRGAKREETGEDLDAFRMAAHG